MSAHDFQLWLSLYVATAVCCMISLFFSVARVSVLLVKERIWATTIGWKAWMLLGPRIWWRWQKTYLLTTPVTLTIVAMFAYSLPWGK